MNPWFGMNDWRKAESSRSSVLQYGLSEEHANFRKSMIANSQSTGWNVKPRLHD